MITRVVSVGYGFCLSNTGGAAGVLPENLACSTRAGRTASLGGALPFTDGSRGYHGAQASEERETADPKRWPRPRRTNLQPTPIMKKTCRTVLGLAAITALALSTTATQAGGRKTKIDAPIISCG